MILRLSFARISSGFFWDVRNKKNWGQFAWEIWWFNQNDLVKMGIKVVNIWIVSIWAQLNNGVCALSPDLRSLPYSLRLDVRARSESPEKVMFSKPGVSSHIIQRCYDVPSFFAGVCFSGFDGKIVSFTLQNLMFSTNIRWLNLAKPSNLHKSNLIWFSLLHGLTV